MEDAQQQDSDPADAAPDRKRWFRIAISRKWVIGAGIVLGITVAAAILLSSAGRSTSALGSEVTLGEFEFVAGDVPGTLITAAKFRLHVSLLRKAEETGLALLESRQYKVQQEVEQLLRRAKSADFEDPLLADLKRQMQEMINETIGARVIEEIIITDLALTRSEAAANLTFESTAAPEQPTKLPGSADSVF